MGRKNVAWRLAAWVTLFSCMSTIAAAETLQEQVERAIASAQLPWEPVEGSLRGVRIAVNTPTADVTNPTRADELNRWTWQYVRHLLSDARASLTDREADVTITLRYDLSEDVSTAAPAQDDAIRQQISGALRGAETRGDGLAPVSTADRATKSATVTLAYAAADPRVTDRPWELYTANARAIVEAIIAYAADTDLVDTRAVQRDRYREARRAARRLVPQGELSREQISWFCNTVHRFMAPQQTLTYFDADVAIEDEVVVLSGATNLDEMRGAIVAALDEVGVRQVRNEMRALPDVSALNGHLLGICVAPRALTYNAPRDGAGLQSELLYGELLYLLDRQGAWTLVHGADGYWGWVASAAVRPIDEAEFDARQQASQAVLLSDVRRDGRLAPRGSVLPIVKQPVSTDLIVLDASGEPLDVDPTAVQLLDVEDDAHDRVRRALDLLHTPYVFGGRSSQGLDCSGLVANVKIRSEGWPARDAWQQALAGRLIATNWRRTGAVPGDLIFFINDSGRVYHTGVMISETHFVHAAPPAVRINSFVPGDRLYERRADVDFFMIKRP